MAMDRMATRQGGDDELMAYYPSGDDTCDVCGEKFEAEDMWLYHARLGVYVHMNECAAKPVRGEDITSHTVTIGQMPVRVDVCRHCGVQIKADSLAPTAYWVHVTSGGYNGKIRCQREDVPYGYEAHPASVECSTCPGSPNA